MRRPLPLAAAIALLPACSYLSDRARDLGDAVSLETGYGLGLHGEIHATEAIRLDAGCYWEGREYGITEGRFYRGRHYGAGFPILAGRAYVRREPPDPAGDGNDCIPASEYYYFLCFPVQRLLWMRALPDPGEQPTPGGRPKERWHFGGHLDLGVLSLGAGIDAYEIADLLAGLVTWDPSRDDARPPRRALREAILALDFAEVRAIAGASPRLADTRLLDGRTPLLAAVEAEDEATVRLLLDKGADPDSRDRTARTPLHIAAEKGRGDLAGLLLDHGADIGARGGVLKRSVIFGEWDEDAEMAPLHFSATGGSPETAELLLDRGADPDARDKRRRTPLHVAAARGCSRVVERLLARGAKGDLGAEGGLTPLHYAALRGDSEIAQTVLQAKADPNGRIGSGPTPLQAALFAAAVAEAGRGPPDLDVAGLELPRLERAREPIEADAAGGHGRSPQSRLSGVFARLSILLPAAKPVARALDGTPLSKRAGAFDAPATISSLLSAGADPNLRDPEDGATALHFAAEFLSPEIVSLLLDQGADPGVKDKQGRTPLAAARAAGRADIVELLLRRGARE